MAREKVERREMLARAPAQPPREVCERENTSKLESEKGDETKPIRNTRKQIFIKEGQANCGKQMKSRVWHLV